MQSSISETIRTSLDEMGVSNYYQEYGDRVAIRLAERERRIFASLVEAGMSLGATRRDVEGALVEAGLTAPSTVTAESNGSHRGDEDMRTELASITHEVKGLAERIDTLAHRLA